MNIIEKAVLNKFRFPSHKGDLTVSQLAELPLESKTNISLDTVALGLLDLSQSTETKSFVTQTTKANSLVLEKLEVVKAIIAHRMAERDAIRDKKSKAEETQKLLRIREAKRDAALEGKTEAEIDAMIAKLQE